MTRENQPYDTKAVITEEDVQKLKDLIHRDDVYLHVHGFRTFICEEAEPIVERMWQEIRDLRSALEKQVY